MATLSLDYRLPDGEDARTSIDLQTTPVQFGGTRWWFTCPLRCNGIPCNRRCGKLYLYPGLRYFGCRHCLGLTYRSSREAHQFGRACASMGFGAEETRLLAERFRRKLSV